MKRFISHIFICLAVFFALLMAALPQHTIAAPAIYISPKSGAPGTSVNVAGSNFVSYSGDSLKVFFNDTEVASFVPVASGGNFQVVFKVPAYTEPGDAIISVRQAAGSELARESFNVPAPEIRLSAWGGAVNTAITITCRGFYAGKPVTFYYQFDDKMDTIGVQNAGETGECSISLDVPASPSGQHLFVAANEDSQSATTEFEIIPSVAVEPSVAGVGDKVTISGAGFTAGNEIEVGLYNQTVAYATASDRGSFNAQFIVPLMKAGKYELQIKDFSGVVEWGELEITSRLNLSRSGGEVGAKIEVSGTGFEVRRPVTITYDAQQLASTPTDDTGAFSTTIVIPVGPAGAHFVTATDGTNTRQVAYKVESDAPSAPVPLTPKRFVSVASTPTFDWESVYDVSQPLEYTLEIARSPYFSQPLLIKSGLIVSQYTPTGSLALPPNRQGTYYYWRVQATDGAGNIGDWSEVVPFSIKPSGVLPFWARYILIALQVAIACVFGYRIWKGVLNLKA